MGSVNKTSYLKLPQWLGNEYLKREDMNDAFAKIDANAEETLTNVEAKLEAKVGHAELRFEQLGADVANRTVSTCVTANDLDTWTSVITDAGGHEVARKVDVEGVTADGYAQWTSTITIGSEAAVVWRETESATGWTKEAQ